nr:MAG TPA: hypothetical protein [Caudoviricetes sp.]
MVFLTVMGVTYLPTELAPVLVLGGGLIVNYLIDA